MLSAVRWWLPGLIILAGFVLLAFEPNETGLEGWAMLVGSGISVFLINFLYRMSVKGDEDRDREEAARRFFDRHGRWPDDA